MQEKKETVIISQRRRARIDFMKKCIRWMLVIGILLPSILSVFLFFKVSNLNRSVNELEQKWNTIVEFSNQKQEVSLEEINKEQAVEHLGISDNNTLDTDQTKSAIINQDMQVEDILPTSTRKIYFTFDDGPSPNTNKILDILAEYDVKATFFVVGKEEEEYKQVYQRIVEEGHTLGLHSYSHKYDEIYASAEDFMADFWKESNFIYEITGIKPFCYRFPGGSSTTRMDLDFEVYKNCLNENNILYYDWNISSQDASVDPLTKEEIILNVTTDLGKYETSIILFHDVYGKQSTVDALPEIIEYIQNMENSVLLPISIGTEQIHQK